MIEREEGGARESLEGEKKFQFQQTLWDILLLNDNSLKVKVTKQEKMIMLRERNLSVLPMTNRVTWNMS